MHRRAGVKMHQRRTPEGPRGGLLAFGARPAEGRRHTLHRHQPRRRAWPYRLPGCLLCPRPGRELHQGVEDPFGRRPHVMLPRRGQPDAPVPASRCLLVDVEPACRHAAALALARRPVRYPASAPDQARRQGRGAEAKGPAPPAEFNPEPDDLRLRAGPAAAHAHLSGGAKAPQSPDPSNLQRRHH